MTTLRDAPMTDREAFLILDALHSHITASAAVRRQFEAEIERPPMVERLDAVLAQMEHAFDVLPLTAGGDKA